MLVRPSPYRAGPSRRTETAQHHPTIHSHIRPWLCTVQDFICACHLHDNVAPPTPPSFWITARSCRALERQLTRIQLALESIKYSGSSLWEGVCHNLSFGRWPHDTQWLLLVSCPALTPRISKEKQNLIQQTELVAYLYLFTFLTVLLWRLSFDLLASRWTSPHLWSNCPSIIHKLELFSPF